MYETVAGFFSNLQSNDLLTVFVFCDRFIPCIVKLKWPTNYKLQQ